MDNNQPPIHHKFIDDITTLLSYPPPFVYVNDPTTLRITASILKSTISSLPSARLAFIDAISCFTPRLIFDEIINALAGWTPQWDSGCSNWHMEDSKETGERESYDTSLGDFMRGLRDVYNSYSGKGKGKAAENPEARMVIVIENAERLKDNSPSLVVPLTRLAELSQLDSVLTVIFLSRVRWEDIRPAIGASPDPFPIDVDPISKDGATQFLEAAYLRACADTPSGAYDPSLLPLYKQFASAVVGVSFPFTHDPEDLQYVVAAQWPRFAEAALREEHADEVSRMRLLRSFAPSMTAAFEALYPREVHADDLVDAEVLPSGSLAPSSLPRMHKFILLSSYILSANPAKTDLRMFGRGLDERGRRKKRKGGGAKPGAGKSIRIAQRLLGPSTFPLDRLIALLGALIEENDADDDRNDIEEGMNIPGEWTDLEVGRVGVLATINELTSMRLLHRTSAAEKLDGPPMFKCGVTLETALEFARELGVPLMDLLWE